MIFRITFGQQYRYEPHPTLKEAHPDNWIEIDAPDLEAARRIAFQHLGRFWSWCYTPEEWKGAQLHFLHGRCIKELKPLPF